MSVSRMVALLASVLVLASVDCCDVWADSRGGSLKQWINERGKAVWGEAPALCDDLTFARRVYLDLLGRVPSLSELHDYEAMTGDRRSALVDALVFGDSGRGDRYHRLSAEQLARQWRQVLLPTGTSTVASASSLEAWLSEQFRKDVPYDQWMRQLVATTDGSLATGATIPGVVAANYYQLLGGLPEVYAGNISRVAMGVRMECAQCHDHPFTAWKQQDFWGLAAFYGDLANTRANGTEPLKPGRIVFENREYSAKLPWESIPVELDSSSPRLMLAAWMTSPQNRNFAASAVNRVWQQLIGRGLYPDVENLDLALPDERRFADDLGQRFAADGYRIRPLIAAICKSAWYQVATEESRELSGVAFYRPMKVVTPEQVFDSLEESLHLPISRVDPMAARWTGDRVQLVSRLSEANGRSPEDYSSGIPQALLLMNGKLTSEAVAQESGRLLRAITDAPFFTPQQQIEALYLSVLTRRPVPEEMQAIETMSAEGTGSSESKRVLGELLWALINSPEFVLCR